MKDLNKLINAAEVAEIWRKEDFLKYGNIKFLLDENIEDTQEFFSKANLSFEYKEFNSNFEISLIKVLLEDSDSFVKYYDGFSADCIKSKQELKDIAMFMMRYYEKYHIAPNYETILEYGKGWYEENQTGDYKEISIEHLYGYIDTFKRWKISERQKMDLLLYLNMKILESAAAKIKFVSEKFNPLKSVDSLNLFDSYTIFVNSIGRELTSSEEAIQNIGELNFKSIDLI